jgi:hypothetical protein
LFYSDSAYLQRNCTTDLNPGVACGNYDFFGVRGRACFCTTDFCNSATRGVLSNYVMFIAAGLTVHLAVAVELSYTLSM